MKIEVKYHDDRRHIEDICLLYRNEGVILLHINMRTKEPKRRENCATATGVNAGTVITKDGEVNKERVDEIMYTLADECDRSKLEFNICSELKSPIPDLPPVILYSWEIMSDRRGESNSCTGFDTLGDCVEDCLDWAIIIRESREGRNPLP